MSGVDVEKAIGWAGGPMVVGGPSTSEFTALVADVDEKLGDGLIDISKASAGDDNLVDVVQPLATTGGLIRIFAVSTDSGLISLGALDAETLRLLANDLYGDGATFPRVVSGEDGMLDVLSLPISDGQRARLLAVDSRTGLLEIGALSDESLARLAQDLGSVRGKPLLGRATVAEPISLIWQSGQSLSLGQIGPAFPPASDPAENLRVLSAAPYTPYGYMFNTGLRGVIGGALDASALTDFVPAQDAWDVVLDGNGAEENRGQVPGTSMMARLAALAAKDGEIADMVWRGHGRGGRRLDQLQADSGSFQNGLIELQRAIAIAQDYGRSVFLPAIMWTQGEQERSPGSGTTVASYKAGLVTLLDSYNDAYLPLLPVGHPEIVMIIDQTAAWGQPEAMNPAIQAQYEAMRDLPGFFMACPKYWVTQSDYVHLRPNSTALLGEYQAQAWHEVCVKGNTAFRPTMPESITRSGTTITLTLKTPFGDPIAFDTTTLPQQTNYGFEYEGANIVSVTLLDPAAGTIRIVLDAAVGGTLGYAATGTTNSGYGSRPAAWGNVRDTSLRRSVTLPNRALHNWLVAFKEPVA